MENGEIRVMGARHYWHNFILDGLQERRSPAIIREKVKERFVSEMLGQVHVRLNLRPEDDIPDTEKSRKIVASIAKQTLEMWKAVCKLCARYRETRDICRPDDLVINDEVFKFENKTPA